MDYIYRNTKPKPLPTPAPKKIVSPAGQRLSVIMENNNSSSVHPALRQHRFPSFSNLSIGRRSNASNPSATTLEKPPPRYSTIYADGNARTDEEIAHEGPSGIKGQLKRRGGWKRVIACLIVLIIVIAVALGVGLGVGLNKGSSSSGGPSSPIPTQTPNPFQPPQAFPLGSYTIETNLQSSSAACTSNSATWDCPPDDVTWTISNTTDGALRILSTNPFASFGPIALSMENKDTANEHYTFSTVFARPITPSVPLTSNNVRTTCFYNSTTFSGSLYTRKARTYPSYSNSTSSLKGGMAGEDWPFAVEFSYTAGGGRDVPNCYELVNGQIGTPVTTGLTPQSSTADCTCAYQNWG